MSTGPSLVWFRLDLRLADNPALLAAVERGAGVIPAFIWAPEEEEPWAPGAASRAWLHHSLAVLQSTLEAHGAQLVIRHGPTLAALRRLARATRASAVYWNRSYEPQVIARDREIEAALRSDGLAVENLDGSLLFEPAAVRNKSGKPFQVFTAFWNACRRGQAPPLPLQAPASIGVSRKPPESLPLSELRLLPEAGWAAGLREFWKPGETGGADQLRRFLSEGLAAYADGRDRPGRPGTSRLSPHLHFGEISPRQVWHAVSAAVASGQMRKGAIKAGDAFLRELGWREFASHLLFHFPHTPTQPLRREFADFPWRLDPALLKAWQRGRTGYPIVDAGMRELWHTGWMHNRVRMVAASFLVKDLLTDWKEGALWFWDTLVDADLANNTLGWQWVAGCGADAAPYFRIFNPVTQGEKFDPEGEYVRRWVPELGALPSTWIHKPWSAPPSVLAGAGIELGKTYPRPIVDHAAARRLALEAFASRRE